MILIEIDNLETVGLEVVISVYMYSEYSFSVSDETKDCTRLFVTKSGKVTNQLMTDKLFQLNIMILIRILN